MNEMYEARIDKETEKSFFVTPLNFKWDGYLWIPKSQVNDVFMVREWLQKQLQLDKALHLAIPAAGRKAIEKIGTWTTDPEGAESEGGATITDIDKELEEFGEKVDEISGEKLEDLKSKHTTPVDLHGKEEEEGKGFFDDDIDDDEKEGEGGFFNEDDMVLVSILEDDIPAFAGTDGKTYELRSGDIIKLPKENAAVLIERKVAELHEEKPGETKERFGPRAEAEMEKIKEEQGKNDEKNKWVVPQDIRDRIEKSAIILEECIIQAKPLVDEQFPDLEQKDKDDMAERIGVTLLIRSK